MQYQLVTHLICKLFLYKDYKPLVPNTRHSAMRESSNKARMDVWAELGMGFKRFADKAEAQAEGSASA